MYCVTLYLFFIRWWCNLNEFPPNLTSNLCPVELGVNPWISTHFEQYFLPGRIRPAGRIRPVELGVNPWLKLGWNSWIYTQFEQYFLPGQIRPAGQIWPVELGVNPWLKLGWNSWIYTQFEQYFLPGRIRPAGRIRPVKLGVNPWLKLGWNSWIYSQFDRAWNTAQIGLKFMDLHPIWAVFLARSNSTSRSNSTGRIGSKSMAQIGLKFMDLLPIHARSNWVSSQWIQLNLLPFWAVFLARSNSTNRSNSTGRIGSKSMAQIGLKFMDLLPIHARSNWVSSQWIQLNLLPFWAVFLARSNFKFDWAWNTAQFGLKFMDLLPIHARSNWVSSQWIYSHFEQYFLPGRIGSKSMAQIGLKFMDLLPIHARSNWVSSQWIYSHFEQYFMPGRIRPVKFDQARNTAQNGSKSVEFIGMIPNLSLNRHGFTPNSTGH